MAQQQQKREPAPLDLWAENETVWNLWCVLGSAWRLLDGMGGTFYLGLDLPSVWAAMKLMRVKKGQRLTFLAQLQDMEYIARPILNERD